jgi:hypothetical protein
LEAGDQLDDGLFPVQVSCFLPKSVQRPNLTLRGNLRAIRERAAHIETLGEQYAPFARKLRELAKGFEERAILALVVQYMGEETESEERRSRL